MISLLYVSRAALQAGSENRQLMDILTIARTRNGTVRVTGALIHVDGYFAQILEGPAPAVNQLMIDILRDQRHSDVRIIEVVTIAERRFPSWSMASVPPSPAPRRYLATLAQPGSDHEAGAAAQALKDYLATFADAGSPG